MHTIQERPENLALEVPRPFGQSKNGRFEKSPGLKAEANAANGGIGVSYSYLALGGDSALYSVPKTSYQMHYSESRNTQNRVGGYHNLTPNRIENNLSHKSRFVYGSQPISDGSQLTN